MNYCSCGSLILNGKCTNRLCPEKNSKHKGWMIEGIAMDFRKPVSYDEAADTAKKLKKIKLDFEKELEDAKCIVHNLL